MNLNRFQVITSQVVEVVSKGHTSGWPSIDLTTLIRRSLHHEGNSEGALKLCYDGAGRSFTRLSGLDNVDRFSNPLSQLLLAPLPITACLSNTSREVIDQLFGRTSHDVVFLSARRWRSSDVPCSLKAWCFTLRCKVHLSNATVASGDFCLPSPDAFNRHLDGATEFTFAHGFHAIVTLFEPFGTTGAIDSNAIS